MLALNVCDVNAPFSKYNLHLHVRSESTAIASSPATSSGSVPLLFFFFFLSGASPGMTKDGRYIVSEIVQQKYGNSLSESIVAGAPSAACNFRSFFLLFLSLRSSSSCKLSSTPDFDLRSYNTLLIYTPCGTSISSGAFTSSSIVIPLDLDFLDFFSFGGRTSFDISK